MTRAHVNGKPVLLRDAGLKTDLSVQILARDAIFQVLGLPSRIGNSIVSERAVAIPACGPLCPNVLQLSEALRLAVSCEEHCVCVLFSMPIYRTTYFVKRNRISTCAKIVLPCYNELTPSQRSILCKLR